MAIKIKETILGFSIAIILMLFVIFGIKAFYDDKQYDDFCNQTAFMEKPYPYRDPYLEPNKSVCYQTEMKNYDFEKECNGQKGQAVYAPDANGCRVAKECNFCNRDYNDYRNVYNRNVFIISGIAGIIAIVIGAILSLTSVSAGLFGGGVLTILYGTIVYWSELANWARFIILGVALFVLIYLGYKKFNRK